MLFEDFLILTIEDDADGKPSQPKVSWRMKNADTVVNDIEIGQFCYPYPELLKKTTARSALPADEFVFVLSKAGEGNSAAITRTFGFCRRCIGPGIKNRHDLGLRYPECLCLLTTQPLFSLFPSILKTAHSLRLLENNDEQLSHFIYQIRSPKPFPMNGETFRIKLNTNSLHSELCFQMPAFTDSSMFADVGVAALLHCLGPRRYLLLLIALLSERRIIMVASSLRKLTSCMHCAVAALQPFSWQHIFIPLLPSKLLNYACAPYPYLIGLHISHLPEILDPDGELPLSEVLVVDLDRGDIHVAGNRPDNDDGPPLIRDVVGAGIMTSQHVVRRGADKLDGLRVRATRYLASRLEMLTPIEIASSVETYSEKTADAAASLSQHLHSIVATHTGKTPGWFMAVSTEDDAKGQAVEIAEAAPAWVGKGSPAEFYKRSSSSSNSSSGSFTPPSLTVNGLGPDDFALSEALLVFFLQIMGNPKPFITPPNEQKYKQKSDLRRPTLVTPQEEGESLEGESSEPPLPVTMSAFRDTEIESVRERYLASRKSYRSSQGCGDSNGLSCFLKEFIHTQMFQCFSIVRALEDNTDSNNNFFLCAAMISQLGQTFDRKSIRRAVQRLQIGDGSSTHRYHPLALQLTSNSTYTAGDAKAALSKLCCQTVREVSELEKVIHTVQWRLMDSAGLRWRHGYKALLLLRGLILYGPEACVVEGLDLFAVVRGLQFYKSGLPPGAGSGSGEHIRQAARELVPFLVDMGKLKQERYRLRNQAFVHALRLRPITSPPILKNYWNTVEVPLSKKDTFNEIHQFLNPKISLKQNKNGLINDNVAAKMSKVDQTSSSNWLASVTETVDQYDVLDFESFVVKDTPSSLSCSSSTSSFATFDHFNGFQCDWATEPSSQEVPPSPVHKKERAPSWAELPDPSASPELSNNSTKKFDDSDEENGSFDSDNSAHESKQFGSNAATGVGTKSFQSQSSSLSDDWDSFWSKPHHDPFLETSRVSNSNVPPDPFSSTKTPSDRSFSNFYSEAPITSDPFSNPSPVHTSTDRSFSNFDSEAPITSDPFSNPSPVHTSTDRSFSNFDSEAPITSDPFSNPSPVHTSTDRSFSNFDSEAPITSDPFDPSPVKTSTEDPFSSIGSVNKSISSGSTGKGNALDPFSSIGSVNKSISGGSTGKSNAPNDPFSSIGSANKSISSGSTGKSNARTRNDPFSSIGSVNKSISGGSTGKGNALDPFSSIGSVNKSISGGSIDASLDPFSRLGSANKSISSGSTGKSNIPLDPFSSIGSVNKSISGGSTGKSNAAQDPFSTEFSSASTAANLNLKTRGSMISGMMPEPTAATSASALKNQGHIKKQVPSNGDPFSTLFHIGK